MAFYVGTAFIALVTNFSSKWHRYIDRLIELIKLISFRQIDGRFESTRNHQDLSFVDHYNYSKTNIKIISLEWHTSQMDSTTSTLSFSIEPIYIYIRIDVQIAIMHSILLRCLVAFMGFDCVIKFIGCTIFMWVPVFILSLLSLKY